MDPYVERVEAERRGKDDAFRHDPRSPIPAAERARFEGLRYYPVDPAWRFRVRLVPKVPPGEVVMQASAGDVRHYRHAGHFPIQVEGKEVLVQAYENADGHGHFIPFRDRTSGKETYGAGRYLEVGPADADGLHTLDFNLAYNPFCAYDDAYSCPFPPPENWLQVPILAGERSYH